MSGILASDLGLDTGYAIERGSRPPVLGSFSVRHLKGLGVRFLAFEDWWVRTLTVYDPNLVIFEAPIPRGKKPGIVVPRITFGLAGIVEKECARRHIKCVEAAPSEVKKFFTGSGRADKDAMIRECVSRGWEVDGDDAADAAGLMAYAVSLYRGISDYRHI